MNIAVINAKDLFRYILKFLVIVSITFFMVKILKTIDLKKQEDNIKENSNEIKRQINEYSFTKCLSISIPLMEYGKEKKEESFFTSNKILAMGASILDKAILENTDLVINKDDLSTDDAEELVNKALFVPIQTNAPIIAHTMTSHLSLLCSIVVFSLSNSIIILFLPTS